MGLCGARLSTHVQLLKQLSSSFMACFQHLPFFLALSCFLLLHGSTANQTPKHYIVYMGGSSSSDVEGDIEAESDSAYLNLLSSIIPSEESERLSLIHSYNHAFKGFSAMLTEEEASVLFGYDEIVSIFLETTLHLHTTRSWDYLEARSGIRSDHLYSNVSTSVYASNIIIGVIDTGIWPELQSFNDEGIGEIPSRWRGVCMEGPDFKKSNCNRKLIGARYYNIPDDSVKAAFGSNSTHTVKDTGSPRDLHGHGTHTASTAAGVLVANASYYGHARGTSRGGSPSSRLAIYKACLPSGECPTSIILKAIDDAVRDGVDILSISLGADSVPEPDFLSDASVIGALHAENKGVTVVCSAGNSGPNPYTVVNSAPWLLTVAASTMDRDFQTSIVLGNGNVFQGTNIYFSNLSRSKLYPLAISNCSPGFLGTKKVAGKIIVCISGPKTMISFKGSIQAKGLILIDEEALYLPAQTGIFPLSTVGDRAGVQILEYIFSTKNPTATILPTVDVNRVRPAPVVAPFSSRGPGVLTENILKPDVTAPGVGILAATIPSKLIGKMQWSEFGIKSGTSMACPHVSGVAAVIKSVHSHWTPSMIKSALMTTASTFDNMGMPLRNSTYGYASPHEIGAGEINVLRALDPGLVYETTMTDYLYFLCYYGYPTKIVRGISKDKNFNCPKKSIEALISNLNYPSISISKLKKVGRMIKRTVTNVGLVNATYIAKVDSPPGLVVKVLPKRLVFSVDSKRASFKVSFYGKGAAKGYQFGSVTWFDGLHFVRTVFAVNVV